MTLYAYPSTYRLIQYQVDTTVGGTSTIVLNSAVATPAAPSGFIRISRVADPLWKYKIAAKRNASNPYSRTSFDLFIQKSSCQSLITSSKLRSNATMHWAGILPESYDIFDQATDDRALAGIKRKLSMHAGDMNALTPIVELRDLRRTIQATANLSIGMLHALVSLKKRKGLSKAKVLSEASKIWLTFNFGVAPLIADSKRIVESIDHFKNRTDHVMRISSTAERTWKSGHNVLSAYQFPTGAKFRSAGTVHHSISYRYGGAFNMTLRSANDYGITDHLSLGPAALVPTMWELVPFSWVVDYFTNVGQYLDDVFIATPGTVIYLNKTRKYEARGVTNISYEALPGTIILDQVRGACEWRYTEFQRTPLATLPARTLRFKTVDEIGKYWVSKTLNLASILGTGISPTTRKK